MNMPLALLNRRRRGAVAFSPAALFALAEPGVWYDPSDVANLDWRRNLLTWTEQFDNAAWTKTGLTVSGNQISYAGGSGLTRECVQLVTIPGGTANKVLTAYVTVSGSGKFRLKNTHSAVQDNFSANITATGTRQTVTLTVTNSASAGNGLQAISIITSTDDAAFSLTVHEFQLELGSTATEYQRITDVNTEVIQRFPSATLYQDTAGTTPVTTPGQSVALALDKSKGLVLGSELVTNGDFSAGSTGWSLTNVTVSGGVATFGSGTGFLAQNNILQIGKTYRVTFTLVTSSAGNDAKFHNSIWSPEVNLSAAPISSNPGTYTLTLRAVSTNFRLDNYSGTGFQVDNISVKELPGFHATQATAGSRPIYGIVPVGGRRNLLTFTEQFDNAAWVKGSSTVVVNNAVAPDGTTTADLLYPASSGNNRWVYQTYSGTSNIYTRSVYAKASGKDFLCIDVDGGGTNGAYFNLSTGAVGTVSAGYTASIQSVGSGWYRCSVRNTSNQTLSFGGVYAVVDADNSRAATASGTNGILIWGAQLETGSTATAYQRVVSQYDVTEAGVSSLSYLAFDGVDDFLVTPTITPGIDKAQVFAGVRKLSDAAGAILVESSASYSSNSGAFYMAAPESNVSSERYSFCGRGNAASSTAHRSLANAGAAPDQAVLTGQGDISADSNIIRRNGVAFPAGTFDQGTGNYLAYPLYIGRRGGTTVPLNGQIFSLIVRFGANLTADQITSTETWVNGKTRAY